MSDQHDESRLDPIEGPDPVFEAPAMESLAAGPTGPLKPGHPRGLWVLFITEMWERFSYYGMRAILVLYLIAGTSEVLTDGTANTNPGFGWTEADAYLLYGVYTFMVYLTAIFGGLLADRFLGTHRSMLIGGWIIALGHITLACTEFFDVTPGSVVTFQESPGAVLSFMLGLSLIIVGTGFFKPCVSVMVGQLYEENDPRRDSGFTIFYMGINLGAFFSPIVAGTLGEKVGWHWGFGSAAVGMIAGLLCYQALRPRYLGAIGLPPQGNGGSGGMALAALSLVAGIVAIPLVPLVLYASGGLGPIVELWATVNATPARQTALIAVVVTLLIGSIIAFILRQNSHERAPLGVIFILAFFGNIFFWTAFEQAGSSMNVFAAQRTDRTLWGLLDGDGFPATWYQSINPLCILLFAPVFAWLWVWLDRRNLNPSTPLKFSLGLWLLGLAFIAMILGALEARTGLSAPHWLLITYVVYTWGELCLSPVGLSMVTKLAPERLQSFMMGVWFFTFALSNLCAGLVARVSTKFIPDEATGEAEMAFLGMEGLPGFFLMLVVFPVGMGCVIALMSPVLKRMMHGIK
ncbi:MAG: peptide MFS transporter [Planctomycetota bacterium]|jgi:POT family proton-dependent oligopeptide transporter